MDKNNSFIDYYMVLESDRKASIAELKKNYQRLILSVHPDKNEDSECRNVFLLIQKAWSVLRDPDQRKQYDAKLKCFENTELLLYETVPLINMDYDPDENMYTYNCRCGGTYILEENVSMPSSIVIGCDECSFSILVNR